jgi:cytoskeletal protein CcmA (bactofilin family)
MPDFPPAPTSPSTASVIGPTLVIDGTVSADEDLEIRGSVRGHLSAPSHCVTLSESARVQAEVLARDITVHGTVTGKLTATEIIDIRRDARVQAQVAAPRLALEEGGTVNGRIETRSVDAAVRVAQYRNQK